MVVQLTQEDLKELLASLSSTVDRTATVYNESDLVGSEICQRRLCEDTKALVAILLSQSDSSLGDLFGSLPDS